MKRAAFTLIELLVVIVIIGVIVALAMPTYHRMIAAGRASACVSNLRQLGTGLNLYLGEHDMTMPTLAAGRSDKNEDAAVIDNTFNSYLKDPRIFACPADTKGFAERTGTSYYWNVAVNGQALSSLNFLKMVEDHSHIPILADKEGFHLYSDNKVNLLYADGHATKELSFVTSK